MGANCNIALIFFGIVWLAIMGLCIALKDKQKITINSLSLKNSVRY